MASIIEMPKLSDTMSVGTVVKWHKKKGDTVSNGDVLAEIETDKATMELENFDDGVLLEVFVSEGDEAPIGSPLAAVGEVDEDIPELPATKSTESIPIDSSAKDDPPVQGTVSSREMAKELGDDEVWVSGNADDDERNDILQPLAKGRILASPLAKKIAKDQNIDLSLVIGSGPNGRVIKKDLLGHDRHEVSIKHETQPVDVRSLENPSSIGNLTKKIVPISKMRSVIASRLLHSKTTIPHFYLQKEINSQPLLIARQVINEKLKARTKSENPLRVTINDLILKACAETIKWIPEINTSWEENGIQFHGNVNLAFGVAVEDGLVTPVIKNAESLLLTEVSLQSKTLIEKARSKKITAEEMSGSTFTVTNLGMYGVDFFSGIINPPNAAILSVGASVKKPVVNEAGGIGPGETMMLGLSCDHRLVDGAVGAQFLKMLADNLQCPSSMLV